MNQIQKMINERYNSKERELTKKLIANIKNTKEKIYNNTMAQDQAIISELYKHSHEYVMAMSKLENKKYGVKKEIAIKSINIDEFYNAPYGFTEYNKSKSIININFNDFMKRVIESKSPEEVVMSCLNLATTTFHECYHQCQYQVCVDNLKKGNKDFLNLDNEFLIPKQVFKASMEIALSDLLKNEDYYSKSDNYFKILFERDARVTGYQKTFDIMKKIFDNPSQYMNKSIYEEIVKDMYLENEKLTSIDGKLKDRLLVNIQQLETVFVASPEKLADFPALSLAFNKDGHVKSLHEIVKDFNVRREIIKNNESLTEDMRNSKVNDLNDLYSEVFLNTIGSQSDESIKESINKVGMEPIKELFVLTKNYTNNVAKEQIASAELERKFLEDNPQLDVNPEDVYKYRIESLKDSDKERNLLINKVSKHIGEPIIEENIETAGIDAHEQDAPNLEVKENTSPEVTNFTTFGDFYLTQMRDLRDSYKKREESLIINRDYYRELLGGKSKESIEEKEIKHGRRGN